MPGSAMIGVRGDNVLCRPGQRSVRPGVGGRGTRSLPGHMGQKGLGMEQKSTGYRQRDLVKAIYFIMGNTLE